MSIKRQLLDKMGPCGLLCEKCFAYADGLIQQNAKDLKIHLGNFTPHARRFVSLLEQPVFEKYREFEEILRHLGKGSCQGCRKQTCPLFKDCGVKTCYLQKGVDFCFECSDFPCDHTGFDHNLTERWISLNNRIRSVGLQAYYSEVRDKPRYK